MIQELFSGVVMEDRKLSFPPSLFLPDTSTTSSTTSSPSNPSSPSPSPLPSSCSSSSSLTPASTTSSEPQRENLRCPRCDSSNTKFCYYNNYNLTQPRHFCKTCRRYWTKGGALRNVPIGGGCRKAKPSLPSSSSSSSKPKPKPIPSPEPNAHDLLRLPSSSPSSSPPLLWPSPPSQSSQLLALLRNSGMRNLSYSIPSLKEDGPLISSQLVGEPMAAFNPLTQLSQQQHQQHQQQQQQQHCLLFGEAPSSGFQELYQKLARSTSSGYYCNSDHLHGMVSNVGSGTGVAASNCLASGLGSAMAMGPTSSAVLEPFPSPGGEFGYWNPAVAWPDLPTTTTNGAFP